MIRTSIAGLLGGVVLYLLGFLFWGTPLSALAFSSVDTARSATVQRVLAQTLSENGTGTYVIPDASTQQGTTLFGQGPIATVHFNVGGFPVVDGGALTAGFILSLVVGILFAFALRVTADHIVSFAARARLVILASLAILTWAHLGQPLFNHYGWGYFIYMFLADFIGFVGCGLVIAKMMPSTPTALDKI